MDRIDDLLGDGEETPEQPDGKANAAFAQQRKELAALKKEAEELRAFRAQTESKARSTSVADTLKELGVPAGRAKFYPDEAETTPEAIRAWAIEEEFLAAEGEPVAEGYKPTVIPDSTPLGSKVLSHEEFAELMKQDQNRAFALYQAGRVKLDKLPDAYAGEPVNW